MNHLKYRLIRQLLSRKLSLHMSIIKCLLISWLESPSAVILEPKKIKSVTVTKHSVHRFPIYLPWSDGKGCHGLSFWMLIFKPAFSLSSFIFIKRLFSSSSLSAIRVVSFTYLRLLIFLVAVLIPACALSSLAFHMMYSEYNLNKQGDNTQPFGLGYLFFWRCFVWAASIFWKLILCHNSHLLLFSPPLRVVFSPCL